MTDILVLAVILILLFSTNKFKEVGRIALSIIVGIALIGLIFNNPISLEMFKATNFLLIIVIYILLYGAERFKEKSKIAILIVLGGIVVFFITGILINAPNNFAEGNWKDLLIEMLFLSGSFVVAYVISRIINNIKRK